MKIAHFATSSVVTVGPGDSIDKSICLMEEHGFHHLIVSDGTRVVGILSDRDILISTGWMLAVERTVSGPGHGARVVGPTRIEQIMTRDVAALSGDATPRDAAFLLLDRKVSAMPLMHEGRLLGIVTETDFLKWLASASEHGPAAAFLRREVRELMRSSVTVASPVTPIGDIVDIFRRRRFRHLPVVSDGQLLGIVSDRDVRRALGWATVRDMQCEELGRVEEAVPPRTASDIMHRHVVTVTPGTVLRQAVGHMLERRIHALPVVTDDGVVGIVTQTDFVKAIARERLL